MNVNRFPEGWDEQRVRQVLEHYENQDDEDAAAAHERALANQSANSALIADLNRFFAQFQEESDRASVILAAAVVDEALALSIRNHMVPIAGKEDNLLEGTYAPLSSFSARIDLAHRLGLISARLARDMHILRRIRNDFAHNPAGCSFEDSPVSDRTAELRKSFNLLPGTSIDRMARGRAKGYFMVVAGLMLIRLRKLGESVEKLSSAEEEKIYNAELWKENKAET